jgi:hypothetical protein
MNPGRTNQLLVSVRSADEAAIALEAGADLIDVKEPGKGSLAPAEAEVVAAVAEVVNGAVPLSAALGEWSANLLVESHWHLQVKLNYIKWGLSNYANTPGWGEDLLDARRQMKRGLEVVMVAYADWQKAKSIEPAEVAKFAKRYRYRAMLIDTFTKDKKSLLDYLDVDDLTEMVANLRASNVQVALGGSLKIEQLKQLKAVGPDWFAVRGAVCAGGHRAGDLDASRIKKWKDALS